VEAAQKLAPKTFSIQADVGAGGGGSDHVSFSLAKIPTFFFFTGTHEQYHRPTDTADRINFEGMVQLAGYAKAVALDLANADTIPAFDPETAKMPARGGGSSARIAFGIVPDFADNATGFRITGVSRGSTAEAIGLQAGDVIVKFGSRPVKGIQDYMSALETNAPGDKAIIQWLRDGKPMEAEAVLKGRP
jgi:Zn-dependent M28 family amino/carboxypeptidase